jgi:hypothetical protein
MFLCCCCGPVLRGSHWNPCPRSHAVPAVICWRLHFALLLACGIQHDWVDPGSASAASCVLVQRCLDFVLSLATSAQTSLDTRSGPARSAVHSLRFAWSSRPLPDARLPLTVGGFIPQAPFLIH